MKYKQNVINKEGIIISLTEYKDKDAIVTCINKDEVFSFYAKSVFTKSSKNKNSLNELYRCSFSLALYENGNLFLQEVSLKEQLISFESIEVLSCLQFIKDVTSTFIKESSDAREIYPIFYKILCQIKENKADSLTLSLIYFAKVLDVCGYRLEVNKCVRCGSKQNICAISFKDGGFICRDCYDERFHMPLKKDSMIYLRYLFMVSEENFGKIKIDNNVAKDLLYIFKLYIKDIENVTLNSLEFLIKL